MTHATTTAGPLATSPPADAPGKLIWLLLRLRMRLLGNRLRQLADQSPLRVILVLVFLAVIWAALFGIFDYVFTFLRRFEQQAIIAIPLIFHVFVMAMTLLLTFSAAVLVYSALFTRAEPAFLLTTPTHPRSVVTVMYLEALFFASWSLVLLGLPLMLAVGRVEGLPWHFYLLFAGAFLAFVPIPGAIGLVAAIAMATWLPKLARRAVIYVGGGILLLIVLWWGRLWGLSNPDTERWLQSFLGEMQFLKGALLPSTWVTNTIRFGIENRPADAFFYLGVTASTALFFSWASVSWAGNKLMVAYGRAVSAGGRRVYEGRPSDILTRILFFYLPIKMRQLVLKDVRSFLRDPAQWSQLAILFGLLALYLVYLPRTRPEGFNYQWQALICFLNIGAVALILSTFTSRFVFPMVSLEGRQMWLVGLWPLSRGRVLVAKFAYALTVTGVAAAIVTILSVRALRLPPAMAIMQAASTLSACVGLCGLAVGLGARIPSFNESSAGRIASGLGGTVNLIASVALVSVIVTIVGVICLRLVGQNNLAHLDARSQALLGGVMLIGFGVAALAMRIGARAFRKTEF